MGGSAAEASSPTGLVVARASRDELEEVIAILSEAARWLLARGIDQWPDPFPVARVLPALDAGETYLARIDDKPVATITLQWSDALFWGERAPDAAYIHRMAVRRVAVGMGRRLIDWADGRSRAAGRRFLRLDGMAENHSLRGYYEQLGFEYRGEAAAGPFRAALYERECLR